MTIDCKKVVKQIINKLHNLLSEELKKKYDLIKVELIDDNIVKIELFEKKEKEEECEDWYGLKDYVCTEHKIRRNIIVLIQAFKFKVVIHPYLEYKDKNMVVHIEYYLIYDSKSKLINIVSPKVIMQTKYSLNDLIKDIGIDDKEKIKQLLSTMSYTFRKLMPLLILNDSRIEDIKTDYNENNEELMMELTAIIDDDMLESYIKKNIIPSLNETMNSLKKRVISFILMELKGEKIQDKQ